MNFGFRAVSGEDKKILLEKREGEYFRSFVADPEHPIHTTSSVQKAHTWNDRQKASTFLYGNSLDEKGFSLKAVDGN